MFKRRQKYGATRVKHAGHSFASRLESALYTELLLREKAGEIKEIQCQDHIYLTKARILYIPDFKFFSIKLNTYVWAEAKGFETAIWRIKKRLWEYYGPGVLEIYKGSHKKLNFDELIMPKETSFD